MKHCYVSIPTMIVLLLTVYCVAPHNIILVFNFKVVRMLQSQKIYFASSQRIVHISTGVGTTRNSSMAMFR